MYQMPEQGNNTYDVNDRDPGEGGELVLHFAIQVVVYGIIFGVSDLFQPPKP